MLQNVRKIKGAADKNGLKDVTCDQGLPINIKIVDYDRVFSPHTDAFIAGVFGADLRQLGKLSNGVSK